MKKLRHLNAGQPTGSYQINALVDVVNLLLKVETFEAMKRVASSGSVTSVFDRALNEITFQYPGMFEDVEWPA